MLCSPRGRVKLCKERRKWQPFSASLVRIFAVGRVSRCWSNITSYHYNLVVTTNIVVSSIIYRGCRVVVELWGVYSRQAADVEAGTASGCRRLPPCPMPDLVFCTPPSSTCFPPIFQDQQPPPHPPGSSQQQSR